MEISEKLVNSILKHFETVSEPPIFYYELLGVKNSQKVESLEERKEEFRKELSGIVTTEEGDWIAPYTADGVKKFWNYWTEISPKGKKYRFEKEKTFNMKLRLNTWMQRSQSYSIVGLLNNKKKNGR